MKLINFFFKYTPYGGEFKKTNLEKITFLCNWFLENMRGGPKMAMSMPTWTFYICVGRGCVCVWSLKTQKVGSVG